MAQSRRSFIKQASAAAALGILGPRVLSASEIDLSQSADDNLARFIDGFDEATLKAVAQQALDAAKSAGAKYADVRINQNRGIQLLVIHGLSGTKPPFPMRAVGPAIVSSITIGVRAMVGDTWGFAGGAIMTKEEAVRLGTLAVGYAKGGHRLNPGAFEFASAPVVDNGRWTTPIETDPLTVPIGTYVDMYEQALPEKSDPRARLGGLVQFSRCDRVFQSSEGSLIVQCVYDAGPNVNATATRNGDARLYMFDHTQIPEGGYGFEVSAKADLKTEMQAALDRVIHKASLPYKANDVGRYDVVMSAAAMASMLIPTGRALELDRALGHKANEDGTTFAAPPIDFLGKNKVGTPAITITCDRSAKHEPATIGWDEEGVKPEDFNLVHEGVVVDYLTTRSTSPSLASWYKQKGQSVRSHGCAARTGRLQPILQLPNMTLKPGSGSASVEDLIKDVKRGFYFVTPSTPPVGDQQYMTLQMGSGEAYEITNGKIGASVIDMGMQFIFPKFWQSVGALGGPNSVETHHKGIDMPDPDRLQTAAFTAVPAMIKQAHVLNFGREA